MRIGKIILGVIFILAELVGFPKLVEQISSFNIDNSDGWAALIGTLIGHVLIISLIVYLLRSGFKDPQET